ncbi:hypothetical protein [Yinghuangia seranimata]|uniref:hypothetical protein n=1 Tax=Yinghuangia seranimata TaxID=408067 RepID=UPI00248B63AA|nr:hypothetical protein [Yinghuangia seranimata]MDI2129013.1 hypothetical protein [Yinghuangia seranimata]
MLTDRDAVVRAVADSRGPRTTTVGEICSSPVVALMPDDPAGRDTELSPTSYRTGFNRRS